MAYRSSLNMHEFFGVEPSDIFDERESAEGYLAGQILANKIHDEIFTEHGNRSKAFREQLLNGLRETL